MLALALITLNGLFLAPYLIEPRPPISYDDCFGTPG